MADLPFERKAKRAYAFTMLGGIVGLILTSFWFLGALTDGLIMIYYPIGFWLLTTSLILIFLATRFRVNVQEHRKLGVFIVVFSVLSVFSILAIIGGLFALLTSSKQVQASNQPEKLSFIVSHNISVTSNPHLDNNLQTSVEQLPKHKSSISSDVKASKRMIPQHGLQAKPISSTMFTNVLNPSASSHLLEECKHNRVINEPIYQVGGEMRRTRRRCLDCGEIIDANNLGR